jgi:hypothetical protein
MVDAATPDTLAYLLLALAVASILAIGFLASLVIRYRNFEQDIKTIEQLTEEK